MRPTQQILDALEAARAEGRLIERPHVAAVPCVPVASPLATESEKRFMARVVALAQSLGWLCYHTYDSRRSKAGFPDLVLVRGRVVYVELKTNKGKTTAAQKEWLACLEAAGAEVYTWRPRQWDELVAILEKS